MRSAGSVLPARRRERRRSSAWPIVTALAHSFGNSAQNTRAHVRASGSARWTSRTSIPSASASEASPRRVTSGAKRRASCTVHRTGGRGQGSSARSKACRRTRRSKRALWAMSTRPSRSPAISGSTSAAGGAPSTIPCVIPVKRWMPRVRGRSTPTSESNVSWSSPPPTSTAPTSVSSHRSPPSPLVSVSTATNSAPASGWSSRFTGPRWNPPDRTDRERACRCRDAAAVSNLRSHERRTARWGLAVSGLGKGEVWGKWGSGDLSVARRGELVTPPASPLLLTPQSAPPGPLALLGWVRGDPGRTGGLGDVSRPRVRALPGGEFVRPAP